MAPVTMLRAISWTLSVCCGVTHALQQLPAWDSVFFKILIISILIVSIITLTVGYLQIVGSLRALSVLFFNDDEEVLINVCAAFALVLPGVPQQNLCERLLALLRHISVNVRRAALCALIEITKFDENQTNVCTYTSLPLVFVLTNVLFTCL